MDLDGFEFDPPETAQERRKRLAKKLPAPTREELLQTVARYKGKIVRCRPGTAWGALQWHVKRSGWFGETR
jgi:hypothetical protein